ncbi:MAG: hypothetical protein HHAS10_00990 [Candidatus Altimarinota bacterium]
MLDLRTKFDNTEAGIEKLAEYIIESFGKKEKYAIKDPLDISAIFLAGAPGAGKSEFLETIFSDLKSNFIVIDIDAYRKMFRGYNGENASEYQKASVRVADKILKYCFHNHLNFIFDGTFRSYEKVKQNLDQCMHYERKVMVTLIFQEPRISFYYTFLRKMYKMRNVPVPVFIDGFYSSIENAFRARDEYNIFLFVASKTYHNIDKHEFTYRTYDGIKTLESFCKKFRIGYSMGVFYNKERLTLDIESFQNTLIANYRGSGSFMAWLKLWYFKITNNHLGT